MGPLPLNIGKINRLAPAHVLAVCVVQCTSCTECELVQVVCTTDAAPIYIERMRICMAEHMALGVNARCTAVYVAMYRMQAEVTFYCFVPRQFKGPHQYNSDNLRKMIR